MENEMMEKTKLFLLGKISLKSFCDWIFFCAWNVNTLFANEIKKKVIEFNLGYWAVKEMPSVIIGAMTNQMGINTRN